MPRKHCVRLSRRAFIATAGVLLPGVLVGCSSGSSQTNVRPPDFTITAYQGEDVLGGQTVKFSRVFDSGKPVALNFWAGLCPPCRAEMPGFQRVFEQVQDRVVLVGVDIGPFVGLGQHEDARRLLAELGIRYPAGFAVDDTPVRQYRIRSMPTTVFLTPEGQIVETANGMLSESQMRGKLDRLIAAG